MLTIQTKEFKFLIFISWHISFNVGYVHVYENVLRVRAYRDIREINYYLFKYTYIQHVEMTHALVYVCFYAWKFFLISFDDTHCNSIWFISKLAHVYWISNTLEIITFRLVMPKRLISIMDVALFMHYEKKKVALWTVRSLHCFLLYFCWRSENLIPPLCACLHVHELFFLKKI